MSEQEERIKRLYELAKDEAHIRKNALRIAGYYLQAAREEIIQIELSNLDEEIAEDGELYAAYEELIERFADEVTRIGRELSEQARK